MVYASEKYQLGQVLINFTDQTNNANHYTTPPTTYNTEFPVKSLQVTRTQDKPNADTNLSPNTNPCPNPNPNTFPN